jgi:hypothetical protein
MEPQFFNGFDGVCVRVPPLELAILAADVRDALTQIGSFRFFDPFYFEEERHKSQKIPLP